MTLKTPDGSICYASQVPAAAQSIAETTVDPARIAAIFREEGVIPVAQLAAFRTPSPPAPTAAWLSTTATACGWTPRRTAMHG